MSDLVERLTRQGTALDKEAADRIKSLTVERDNHRRAAEEMARQLAAVNSDLNDLDAVVQVLGLQASEETPAEAVERLQKEHERQLADAQAQAAAMREALLAVVEDIKMIVAAWKGAPYGPGKASALSMHLIETKLAALDGKEPQ
jgi:sugar diacid utilization regulator